MIRKYLSFGDQNIQCTAILPKMLKVLISILATIIVFFLKNNFHCNIPLDGGFLTIPILANSFKCSKSCNALKNK